MPCSSIQSQWQWYRIHAWPFIHVRLSITIQTITADPLRLTHFMRRLLFAFNWHTDHMSCWGHSPLISPKVTKWYPIQHQNCWLDCPFYHCHPPIKWVEFIPNSNWADWAVQSWLGEWKSPLSHFFSTYVTCASKTGIMSTALFLRKMKIKKIGQNNCWNSFFKPFKPIFSKQWAWTAAFQKWHNFGNNHPKLMIHYQIEACDVFYLFMK
jgi:hypothetical protein